MENSNNTQSQEEEFEFDSNVEEFLMSASLCSTMRI